MAVVKKISELTAKGSNIGANDLIIVGVSNGTDYDLKSVTGNQLVGAAIAQTITNGVTTTAPSQDAVFDALALKVDTVVGSRLITSAEGTKLSNLSGTNTGDQDLSGYQPLLSGGTTNRLTKWSSSSAITSSLIQDNGTTLSIGTTPVANNLVKVSSNATDTTLVSENSQASGVGISGSSSGANGVGGSFTSTSVTGVKIGVNASATGGGGTNKGAVFGATNGVTNYSIQLTDGTEGSGKFLKSVTANGESNWASISNTDVSGLGTLATQSGTFSGTSSGTNTGDQTISDATITTTDITTNNVSSTKHGFAPKTPNNTTTFLRGDGTWATPSAGGLTYFTEAQSTASPNATVNVDSLTAVTGTTDGDFAIIPKGAGALISQIPDGTITGGNKRGARAVDFQRSRTGATQVASGADTVILSGINNRVTGTYSVIGGGSGNDSSGSYNFVFGRNGYATGDYVFEFGNNGGGTAGGGFGFLSTSTAGNATSFNGTATGTSSFAKNGTSSGQNSVAFSGTSSGSYSFTANASNVSNSRASSTFGELGSSKGVSTRISLSCHQNISPTLAGNSQASLGAVTTQTTTNTAISLLTYNGTVISLPLQDNEAIRVKGSIIGKQTASTNVTCYDFDCVIVRGVGVATTVLKVNNMNLVFDDIVCTVLPTLNADTTNGGLDVKSGGKVTTTIKWVARIDSTEVILA